MTRRELIKFMVDAMVDDHIEPAIVAAREYLAAPEQSEPIGWANAGQRSK